MESLDAFPSSHAGDSLCQAKALTSKLPLPDFFFFFFCHSDRQETQSHFQVSAGNGPGEKEGNLIKHYNTPGENYVTLLNQFWDDEHVRASVLQSFPENTMENTVFSLSHMFQSKCG